MLRTHPERLREKVFQFEHSDSLSASLNEFGFSFGACAISHFPHNWEDCDLTNAMRSLISHPSGKFYLQELLLEKSNLKMEKALIFSFNPHIL